MLASSSMIIAISWNIPNCDIIEHSSLFFIRYCKWTKLCAIFHKLTQIERDTTFKGGSGNSRYSTISIYNIKLKRFITKIVLNGFADWIFLALLNPTGQSSRGPSLLHRFRISGFIIKQNRCTIGAKLCPCNFWTNP